MAEAAGLNQGNDTTRDIVTVHGLSESGGEPWTDLKSPKWLEFDLFVRPLVFNYDDASIHTKAGLYAASQLLLADLDMWRGSSNRDRPLAFICHDLGGIVVKQAMVIAYGDETRYKHLIRSIFAMVFLGCPHRSISHATLSDGIARLMYLKSHGPPFGLLTTAEISASTILETNDEFLATSILAQVEVVNVYSANSDPTQQVFDGNTVTFDISSEIQVGRLQPHDLLLSEDVEDWIYKAIKKTLGYHEPNSSQQIFPVTDELGGLQHLLSYAIPVHVPTHMPSSDFCCGWVRDTKPFISWIENPEPGAVYLPSTKEQPLDLGCLYVPAEERNQPTKRKTKLFTSWLRDPKCHSNDTRSVLRSLLAQAIAYQLPRVAENRPKHILEMLKEPRDFHEDELYQLLEEVSIWFQQHRVRVIWAICNLENFKDNIDRFVARLLETCISSDYRPAFVFTVDPRDARITEALRAREVQAIELPTHGELIALDGRPELELQLLKAQLSPQKLPSYLLGSLPKINDPAIRLILIRFVGKLAIQYPKSSWVSDPRDAILDLPISGPNKLFKAILFSLTPAQHEWAIKVLRWVAYSLRPLSPSNMTEVLRLEATCQQGGVAEFPDNMFDQIRECLCGMVDIEDSEVCFRHPQIADMLPEHPLAEWVDPHLHILGRLLEHLSLKSEEASRDHKKQSDMTFRLDLTRYAIHFWRQHYKLASIGDKEAAQARVREFLSNHDAVMFFLANTHPASTTTLLWNPNPRLAQIALLARHDISIEDIATILRIPGLEIDKELLYPAFLEAVRHGHMGLVDAIPLSFLRRMIAQNTREVLIAAAASENAEIMTLLFKIATLPLRVPSVFLIQAARLGLRHIVYSIYKMTWKPEVGWKTEERIDSDRILMASVSSQQSEVTAVIVRQKAIEIYKPADIMREACRVGDVTQIKLLFSLPMPYSRENKLSFLLTACENGSYLVVKELLNRIDTSEGILPDGSDGMKRLMVAIERGSTRCAEALLLAVDLKRDANALLHILRHFLRFGACELGTCELLLQTGLNVDDSLDDVPVLMIAASTGTLEVVELVINYGADVNIKGQQNDTPLHRASSMGFTQIAELLLDKGADIDSRKYSGATPVYEACSENKPDTVRLLLSRGADIHIGMRGDNRSPLEAAIKFPEVLKLVVNHTPPPDFTRLSYTRDSFWIRLHVTPLFLATVNDQADSVKLLLHGDSDLEFHPCPQSLSEYSGYTALAWAASKGYNEIVRLLLEKGANVNHMILGTLPILHDVTDEDVLASLLEYNVNLELKNPDGRTVLNLHAATRRWSHVTIGFIKRLLNAGADIDTVDKMGSTPISNATTMRNVKMLRELFRKKPKTKDSEGGAYGNELRLAVDFGEPGFLKLIAERGGDVHDRHPKHGTLLQYACATGRALHILEYLVEEHHANINDLGTVHMSLMGEACVHGTYEGLEYLISKGGSVTDVGKVGIPLILLSCFRRNNREHNTWEVIQLLVSHGATFSSNIRDRLGRTMLHCAVLTGKVAIVEYVLRWEPGLLTARDNDGWTALHWALRTGLTHVLGDTIHAAVTEVEQTAMVRHLLDKGCPGLEAPVTTYGREWTVLSLARYHEVCDDIIDAIKEKTGKQELVIVEEETGVAVSSYRSCDSCSCVVKGKAWVCQAGGCDRSFALCFKCIQYKGAVHNPTHEGGG